ncbi:MAG: hypothetical protein WC659_02900 [Patescibacteria group bacterium]
MKNENFPRGLNDSSSSIKELTTLLDKVSEGELVEAYNKGRVVLQQGTVHDSGSPLNLHLWGVEGIAWDSQPLKERIEELKDALEEKGYQFDHEGNIIKLS